MVKTAKVSDKDIILEIGPGLGVITKDLANQAKKVIAIEKDPKMVEILKEILGQEKNIEIIKADALKIDLSPWQDYKVVANIPYYLTAPLIRRFLEAESPPQKMVLLIQKEVARRISAKPPKMSLLAVAVQFYSRPKIISYVSKNSFWPAPKVDSAIIEIKNIKQPKDIDKDKFFQIARAGFSAPRKQLINNLSKGLNLDKEKIKNLLDKAGLKPEARAESLSVEEWIKIAKEYK